MTFYNNRVSIVNMSKDELYLFRNIKEKIIMNYYNIEGIGNEDIIVKDALGEFDVLINGEDELYLIYQNIDNELIMLTIDKKVIQGSNLAKEGLSEVYELNLIKAGDYMNIMYLVRNPMENHIFEIHHHLLREEEWINYNVEKIKINKVLNPIKVWGEDNKIILSYYNENQICIKEFNLDSMEWEESIILTDNKNKLYMDLIKEKEYIHLVYSEYIGGNLVIKYERFLYDGYYLNKDLEEVLSNEGSASHPTLLIHDNILWVVWKESLGLYSTYSLDIGATWSPIYLWKESKTIDYVRYKYIEGKPQVNNKLDYSFGTLYPDIKFLGFGALDNVEEVVKKNQIYKFPRL